MIRTVVLFLCLLFHFSSRASFVNTYNALTLQQKLALLFVVDDDKLPVNGLVPGAVIVNSTKEAEKYKLQNQSLVFINVENGIADDLEVPFPSNQVLMASANDDEVNKLYHQYISINPNIDGILTGYFPNNRNLFYDENLADVHQQYVVLNETNIHHGKSDVLGILPLPKYFMKYQPRYGFGNPSVSTVFDQSVDLPKYLESVQAPLGFSLEDIISKPYLFITDNLTDDVNKLVRAIESQMFDYALLEEKIKWVLSKQLEINIKPLVLTSQKMQHTAKRRLMFESSLSLVMNQDQSVPFANLSDKKIFVFDGRQHLKSDASLKDVVSFHYSSAKWYETFDVNLIDSYVDKVFCCVVLIDDKDLLPQVALSCWKLKSRYPNAQIHLLLNCDNLSEGIVDNDYKCFSSASIGYENNEFIWISSLQGLFGGISLNGKCLFNLKGLSEKNENLNTKKCRVKLGFPEEVGMSTDSLNMISDIMNDAIQNHATPGGQIIVARDGVVVFRKAFGKKTYKTDEPVDIKDLYDIASVTKIMSTTPILMHLAENGLIDLTQPLSKYLPETDTTNKGHLLIYEIMRHKAGLQSMIPTFYNYIDRTGLGENVFSRKYSSAYPYKIDDRLYLNKDANLRQDVFKSSPDSLFSVCVAKDMYMNRQFTDSIYRSILLSKVDTFKIYRYSDMGFCLLQHLVEKVKKQTINRLVDSLIYQPLGLDRITYLPLTRFDEKQLVPTENDAYFRKQLLRGYVHDPGAALMGGVAGNAGVFACADDLCKMMQMYMNNGEYGNVQLFKPETVQKFVRQYSTDSRRGLGFDKPETDIHKLSPVCTEASASSFGHNGFTGTLVWADPETKLVFIFLSNRINPDVTNKKLVSGNTRSLAMEAAYQAIFAPAPSHQQ